MLAIIAVCLSAVSLVLHVIAPRTKTTLDDKAAEAVDYASKALPVVGGLVGQSTSAPSGTPKAAAVPTTQVTGFGAARDHRPAK